jgi:mono/diheme cytochrome c family protein
MEGASPVLPVSPIHGRGIPGDRSIAGSCLACFAAAADRPDPPASDCPQPRFTMKAPPEYLSRTNPFAGVPKAAAAGAMLYGSKDRSAPCGFCHGPKGDGKGTLASQFDPRPRNFQCAGTVVGIPDGRLFWIVRYGSPGTGMPPSKDLSDDQIWQIVSHLRQLAKP